MYIDLHSHSNMSDGSLSPSDLIDLAVESNLSVIALTDHDTLDGIKEARNAVNKVNDKGACITFVPGVEISVDYKGKNIHVLGLLIDEDSKVLNKALIDAKENRSNRNEKMASNFRQAGIPITIDKLQNEDDIKNFDKDSLKENDTVITRGHFATYLIENGYASSTEDAFDKYLGKDGPYYVSRDHLSPQEGIDLIHMAKGLAFMAHPFLYGFSDEELEDVIDEFKEMGLDGIEALHSSHSKDQENTLLELANKHNLLITGGSDFHGQVKPNIKLGIGKGNMKIPYSIYENIKKKKASIF